MKTTAQVRREKEIAIPVNKDSLYKPIEREKRHFNKLQIPKTLQVGSCMYIDDMVLASIGGIR